MITSSLVPTHARDKSCMYDRKYLCSPGQALYPIVARLAIVNFYICLRAWIKPSARVSNANDLKLHPSARDDRISVVNNTPFRCVADCFVVCKAFKYLGTPYNNM